MKAFALIKIQIISTIRQWKIITLIHVDEENCGTLLRDSKGFDNRLTVCYFFKRNDGRPKVLQCL
jgi:hypothetical protein